MKSELITTLLDEVSETHSKMHRNINKYKHRTFWWVVALGVALIADFTLALFTPFGKEWYVSLGTFIIEAVIIWNALTSSHRFRYHKGQHDGVMRLVAGVVAKDVLGSLFGGALVEVDHENETISVKPNCDCKEKPVQTRKKLHVDEIDFRALRNAKGWTQEQLAKKAKVGITTVRKIEKDWKAVGLGSVNQVARALDYEMSAPRFVDEPVDGSGQPQTDAK